MGGCDRYCLSCWNATIHSSDYSNSFHLCSKRKKGLHLSADLDMNRFKAAIIPISLCTSLGFQGGCKLLIALIWSGFTSIPLWVTMYPKNFPKPTPKEHLDAFRRSLCSLRISKMFVRSLRVWTPTCSSQPCHQYRPRRFYLTVVQTFWSSSVDKLTLHFSDRKASSCNDSFLQG